MYTLCQLPPELTIVLAIQLTLAVLTVVALGLVTAAVKSVGNDS